MIRRMAQDRCCRAIQSKIEDAFAEEYLLGNIKAGDKVSVGLKTNGFSFRVVK